VLALGTLVYVLSIATGAPIAYWQRLHRQFGAAVTPQAWWMLSRTPLPLLADHLFAIVASLLLGLATPIDSLFWRLGVGLVLLLLNWSLVGLLSGYLVGRAIVRMHRYERRHSPPNEDGICGQHSKPAEQREKT